MWNKTDITQKLNIAYPIIQGPFGGGFSTVKLVAAVSNAGGLGSFGAHNLAPADIRRVTEEIRAHTDKPFAMNLWVSNHDKGGDRLSADGLAAGMDMFEPYYKELGLTLPQPPERFGESFEEQAEALIDAKPPVFSCVFGIPSTSILDRCRRQGIVTIGAATTLDEALAIEAAGVDIVLATGFEAGGHRPSFLRSAEKSLMGTFALVPQVADRVRIPVVAAGGIADGRGIAAALILGAQGVQMGTAFLACTESNAAPLHREKIFSAAAANTILSRAYTGRLARFIANRYIAEMEHREESFLPYPVQGWFAGPLKQAALEQGRADLTALYAGQGAPQLKHKKAAELMAALVSEVDHILRH
jgi:nitronate monooxygenase